MVVSLSIFLVNKVAVVGTYKLYAVLMRKTDKFLIGSLLQREGFAVGTLMRVFHLMSLKLQIIIVAKYTLIPLQSLACSSHIAL